MLESPQPLEIADAVPAVAEERQAAAEPPALRELRNLLAQRTRQLEASELRSMEALELAQRQAAILEVYAHDLRSPLAAIIGYAELLEMGVPAAVPKGALECVRRIREAAQNVQEQLDGLLADRSARA